MNKVLIIFLLFANIITPNESAETIYYGIDSSAIKDDVLANNIDNLFISKKDNIYNLFINNSSVSENNEPYFDVLLNDYLYLEINFDLNSMLVSINYSITYSNIIQSVIRLIIEENGTQSAYFYPEKDKDYYIKKTAKKINDYYDFGYIEYEFLNNLFYINLLVDSVNNIAYIFNDNIKLTYSLDGLGVDRLLYFEQLFHGREIEMSYMEKDLEKVDFLTAQIINYTPSQIDNAVKNEKIELINSDTDLSYTINLRRTISQWERVSGDEVGTGEYEEREKTIQVVCQCTDENEDCKEIHDIADDQRLYAVWGDNIEYQTIEIGEPIIIEKEISELKYVNVSWPESTYYVGKEYTNQILSENEFSNQKNDAGLYGNVQYSLSNGAWSDWSKYSDVRITLNDDIIDEKRTFYSQRTRSFSNWSDYIYSSCTENDSTKCSNKTLYRQALRGWSNWSSWSSNNSCSLFDSECEDESRVRYSKSTRSIINYTYTWGDKKTSKYGNYQGDCKSETIKSSPCSCAVFNKDGSKCGWIYYNYNYYSWLESIGKYDCTKMTSGSNSGKYYCASSRSAKMCEAAGCETYSSCTLYICPNTKTPNYSNWSVYTEYIYGTCTQDTLTKCSSRKEYRYRNMTDYGAWSNYYYEPASKEWTSCEQNKLCKQEYKVLYSKSVLSDWSNWSDYIYDSCESNYSGNSQIDCSEKDLYRYKTRTWSKFSSWNNTNNPIKLADNQKVKYRFSIGKLSFDDEPSSNTTIKGTSSLFYSGNTINQVSLKEIETNTLYKKNNTIGLLPRMNKANIQNITTSLSNDLISNDIYNDLSLNGNKDINYEDFKNSLSNINQKNRLNARLRALNIFENKEIFIPYFYIRTHWRVLITNVHVPGYNNESIGFANNLENIENGRETLSLSLIDKPIMNNTQIIYFDYTNYDNSQYLKSDNFVSYEEIINEINNIDPNNPYLSFSLKYEDISKMKSWLDEHNYQSINCEMLNEFRYLFDESFQEKIKKRKGCKMD